MTYKKLSFLDIPVTPRDYDNVEPVPFAALLPVLDLLDDVDEAPPIPDPSAWEEACAVCGKVHDPSGDCEDAPEQLGE